MNIPHEDAERQCDALAQIHYRCRAYLVETTEDTDSQISQIVGGLWDGIIANVFEVYFEAINATPAERAELGL